MAPNETKANLWHDSGEWNAARIGDLNYATKSFYHVLEAIWEAKERRKCRKRAKITRSNFLKDRNPVLDVSHSGDLDARSLGVNLEEESARRAAKHSSLAKAGHD